MVLAGMIPGYNGSWFVAACLTVVVVVANMLAAEAASRFVAGWVEQVRLDILAGVDRIDAADQSAELAAGTVDNYMSQEGVQMVFVMQQLAIELDN